MGKPDEIAAAVVWLCSEAAAFVIGHTMVVDGGRAVMFVPSRGNIAAATTFLRKIATGGARSREQPVRAGLNFLRAIASPTQA